VRRHIHARSTLQRTFSIECEATSRVLIVDMVVVVGGINNLIKVTKGSVVVGWAWLRRLGVRSAWDVV
jgi:branched-subunit amino acid ABC-type transport system permease component